MAPQNQRQGRIESRWTRTGLVVCGLLAGVVVCLLLLRAYLARAQFTTNPDLLAELQHATLLELPDPDHAGGDWPGWRGPRRDGVSRETDVGVESWPEGGPPVVWRVRGGGGFSSCAVVNGRVYTLMQDGPNEVVLCLEADTGAEVWRFGYPAHFSERQGGDGPRSTPAVADGRVYAVGATGQFHCLDATTGAKLWQHDLLAEGHAPNLQFGVTFSPLVAGDLVFTNPGGPGGHSLAAFDRSSGAGRWEALDDPAGYSSPLPITAAGVRQVVFFTGTRLVSVAPADGRLYWAYPWKTSYNVNAATPLFFQAQTQGRTLDYLFISSGYGHGCALLKLTPAADGGVQVQPVYANNRFRTHFASSVRCRDHIYGIDEPESLTCLDVRSGKVAWAQRGFNRASLLAAGDRLLVLDDSGKLTLAEASPAGYHELGTGVVLHGKCWTVPVLAHGRLYVRDEQEIVCLDLR